MLYQRSAASTSAYIPSFVEQIMLDEKHRNSCEGCVICDLSATFFKSQTYPEDGYSIVPSPMLDNLKTITEHLENIDGQKLKRHFKTGVQQDSNEFLNYLMSSVESAYKSLFDSWHEIYGLPFNDNFYGEQTTTIQFHGCKHQSQTFCPFQELTTSIQNVDTLIEALDSYFNREQLDGMMPCTSCGPLRPL